MTSERAVEAEEALRMFRDYRWRVGKTIHDLGGYKGLADDLGPLGDIIESALAATPAPRENGWEELRREIERLRVRELIGSVAAERLLAAARGEPPEDAVDLAALLHDNGFTWDDANAVNAILTHHELVVLRAATPSPTPPEGRVGGARKLYDEASFDVDGAPFPPSPTPPEGLRGALERLTKAIGDYKWLLNGRDEAGRCTLGCEATEGQYHADDCPAGILSAAYLAAVDRLAASPAPDLGAGLVDTERGIARHAIVQASIHLANGDLVGAHEDLTVALVALAPSAEPPETETA